MRAYAKMRPRIEAERQLDMVAAFQAAGGRMKKADADKYISRLRRAASGGQDARRELKAPADWAVVGMRVTHEKGGEK